VSPGDPVTYEVAMRGGSSFAWPATVVEDRGRRVMIAYVHWEDGRPIRSLVRRHRVTPRIA
jgi:uncharacterized protein YraI